jgi:predicted permease
VRQLRFAFRTLFKAPFVTGVAILSLALGLGANAAIFSLFNQLLLRPLPVEAPGELVNLSAPGPKPGSTTCNQAGDCEYVFSYPMFRDLEREQSVFSGLAGHRVFGVNLAARGQTENGDGMLVSGGYFQTLGVVPAAGRLIGAADAQTVGGEPVAVLSHAYWDSRFGLDPGVVGQALTINGRVLTIVGVAPRGFEGTTLGVRPLVFVPATLREQLQPATAGPQAFESRRNYWIYLFGRLEAGVSTEQAAAGLNVPYRAILADELPLQKGMSEATQARFRQRQLLLEPGAHGQSSVRGDARAPLTLLFGVTALVLVIACSNIANLLLARSAAREGEMAIRLSIGASRAQLVRQLLTEACLLAALGGLAGLVVAQWTLNLIGSLLPAEAVRTLDMRLDPQALLFTTGLTFATGLLFGLFPALHSTRPDLVSALKNQAGQPSGSRAAARFRTTLATAQIAVSMALLVSAGLFVKSLFNISRVDLGLNAQNVVTFAVSPVLNGYTPDRTRALLERLEDELAAMPGATDVTGAIVAVLAGNNWGNSVYVEGFEYGPDTDRNARFNAVGPAYFRTLEMPLLAGREFTRADAAEATKVAVVNEAFAKKFGLGRDAIGKRIGTGDEGTLDIEIVGVVQNAKYSEVKQDVPPLFFRPYRQQPGVGSLSFYVRAAGDTTTILTGIPRVVARLDPNLPVENLRTLEAQVRENVFLDRLLSVLSAGFASLATILAAVGLYGVLAYTVAQRTREIGVRMALGAAPGRVRGMILRQVGVMTLVGGAIGLTVSVWLGRVAQSLLFELKGSDPAVLAASAAALTLVALAAGFVPALRASRVDPMRALRYE